MWHSDAYILVLGNITSWGNDTKAAIKNCAPFRNCRTEINDTVVDYANFINIAMPIYNLIECSDNYSDTSGSVWQFKREFNGNLSDSTDNSLSFKYKSNLIGTIPNGGRKKWSQNSCTIKIFK